MSLTFSNPEIGFQKTVRVLTVLDGDLGRFRRDFFRFVIILARNRDGK